MQQLTIGKKELGSQHPCFIIAEAGVNHNGDVACKRLSMLQLSWGMQSNSGV